MTGLLAAAALPAQVVDDANAGVQLSFFSPGARSLAMGGAFLGLADDASAAVINPAGLTALRGSQVDLEIRDSKYVHLYTAAGHGLGPASYYGVDNVEGLVYGHRDNDLREISYLSYLYAGAGWTIGAYFHRPADFSANFGTQGAFVGRYSDDPALNTIDRLYPTKVAFDLEADSTGIAAAFDLGKSLSAGLALAYWQVKLDSISQQFYYSHDTTPPAQGQPVLPPNFYAAPLGGASNVFGTGVQHADDNAFAVNLGLLWRLSGALSVGGAYRQGTKYDLAYSRTCGPKEPHANEPHCTPAEAVGKFAVPTVYGIGFALKPVAGMSITLDWDRVAYSEMTDQVVGPTEYAGELGHFEIEDADEVHVGFEYVFRNRRNPISVRAGIWLDPSHQMGYRGASQDPILLATWAAADQNEDEEHLTAGVGWLIADHLTVDLGFDVSDRVDSVSFAAGYRF